MQLTIDMPEEAFSALRQTPSEFAQSMRLQAAIRWYQKGVISQEKAATIAGLSRTAFLEYLALEQVDVFQVDFEDLADEIQRD